MEPLSLLNTARTGTGSVSKLSVKAKEKTNWERSSCSSQIVNGLERGLFSWHLLQCFVKRVNNLPTLIWQTAYFVPKWGVKCARIRTQKKTHNDAFFPVSHFLPDFAASLNKLKVLARRHVSVLLCAIQNPCWWCLAHSHCWLPSPPSLHATSVSRTQ